MVNAQSTAVIYTFDSSDEGWTVKGSPTEWRRGNVNFTTGADGSYWGLPNDGNQYPIDIGYDNGSGFPDYPGAILESPEIDLGDFYDLTLTFDLRYETEDTYDGFTMEYSFDNGTSWFQLGSQGDGTNWFNYFLPMSDASGGIGGADAWTGDNGSWETSSIPLGATFSTNNSVQFRFRFFSDNDTGFDGVGIDNFEVSGTRVSDGFDVSDESTPGAISTPAVLWFRSDTSVVTNGSEVYGWGDWSGNEFHTIGGNAPSLNADGINGYPAINFDGAGNYFNLGDILDLQPQIDSWSFFTVFNSSVGGAILSRAADASEANRQYEFYVSGGDFNQNAGGQVATGSTNLIDEWNLISSTTSTSAIDGYLNGTSEFSGTIGSATETTMVLIGARDSASTNLYTGDLSEIVLFSTALSSTDRRSVESYLAIKYGIAIDVTSTGYIINGITVLSDSELNGYETDIAAIGLSTASSLDQSSSTSYSGNIVSMEDASDQDDDEFLFWGNNNGANTMTSSDVPGTVDDRLSKIWQVSEYGDVGTVDISFDLSTLGIESGSFKLLTLPSGSTIPTDFGTATVSSDGTLSIENGRNVVTFSGIDLTDQSYFTLARVQAAPGDLVTDLGVWLKADAGVIQSNTNVSGWTDQSGNNNDASEGTDFPTFQESVINGNPVVRFDNNVTSLEGTATNSGGNWTYFLVGIDNNTTTSNSEAFFEMTGGSGSDRMWFEDSEYSDVTFGPIEQQAPAIWTITQTGSTANIFENATSLAAGQSTAGIADGSTGSFTYYLGDESDGGNEIEGDIAEFIAYTSSSLTSTQIRDIETYLAIKYGITLDISGSGYTVSGSAIYNETSYADDIAGIGKDNSQGLLQSTSTSQSGGIVTVSDPSDLDDNEYFVWGHNNDPITLQTADVPTGVTNRLDRTWKSDMTGSIGSIDFTFNLDSLDLLESGTYQLIVSSSATMSTGTVYESSSVSDGMVTFENITVSDGDFFTLGADDDPGPGGITSGLTLWLNASNNVTHFAGLVTYWGDQSGLENDAEQADSQQMPNLAEGFLNGNDVLYFDGSDYLGGQAGFNSVEYFVVTKPSEIFNSGKTAGTVIGFTELSVCRLNFGYFAGEIPNEVITHVATNAGSTVNYRSAVVNATLNINEAALVNSRSNANVSPDDQDIFYNGLQQTVTTTTTPNDYLEFTNETYEIGDEIFASQETPYDGHIAEVISYSSRLSSSDRRDVESYLAIKYGITLDISSEDYTAGGSSIYGYSGYAEDIAGIGKNTASALNQASSKSVNNGSIVSMSNPSDLENDEYLIWGNDGGTSTFTSTNAPTGNALIYEKVWVVKETGGDGMGTVDVSFDITSIGIDINNSSLNLVIMASGNTVPDDFDTDGVVNASGILSTQNGRDIVTFEGVDFSDGDFFTLAGDVQSITPVASAQLWLKGDQGAGSPGDQVSSWADQSGNGNDVSQGNELNKPLLSADAINYNNALYFNRDALENVEGFNTTEYFIVAKPDATVNNSTRNGFLVGFETQVSSGFYLGNEDVITNDLLGHTLGTAGYDVANTGTSLTNSLNIFNSRNNLGNTAQEIALNGTSLTVSEAGTYTNITDGPVRIGNDFIGSNSFEGYIAEVISYSSRLSDSDRREVESYLAIKYGITLDISSDPYVLGGSDLFDFTTYINDIFGIGQYLDYSLNQSQSASQEDGIIKIESPSDLDDGDFLIIGNDNGDKTTTQTSELQSDFTERLATEWRASVVGSPGTIDIKVFIGGITNIDAYSQVPSLYSLLVDDDGDFSTIINSTNASSLSSDTLLFEDVTLDSGQYFTLALPGASSLTNLSMWLRADTGVEEENSNNPSDNDQVQFWRDQSGNSFDFSQSTYAYRPTYIESGLNGNPIINFNDGFTYMASGVVNANPRSVFIVYRDTSTASNTTPFTNNDTDDGEGIGHGYSDETQLFDGSLTPTDVRNGDNYANGTDIGDGTGHPRPSSFELHSRVFVSNLSNTTFTYYIGADRGTNDRSIDGDIAEILTFTSALTATERRDTETYLAIKYGLPLDVSTLDYTYEGGTSIYNLSTSYGNDIAGIGANSTYLLNQSSSKSINSDALVTIDGPSSLNNEDFLVWGNDDGVLTEVATNLPSVTITSRMERIWHIEETGDIGFVDLEFDLSALTGTYGAKVSQDFTLILDSDDDFTNGTLSATKPVSFTSNIVRFENIDFTGVSYFSLGSADNLATDTDTDGIPDYFEIAYATDPNDSDDPVAGGAGGTDSNDNTGISSDGISDALEFIIIDNSGNSPVTMFSDTDGDGIPDQLEVINGTDVFNANAPTTNGDTDTDSDGLPDALEILIASEGGASNPDLSTDTDGDLAPDFVEVIYGSNPNDIDDPVSSGNNDSDADNISDALENILLNSGSTVPVSATTDTDGDGLPDNIEAITDSDPYNSASPFSSNGSIRSLTADYVASGGTIVDVNGYQWIDVTDNLGNLIFSINPVGNNLGSTNWGIRVLSGTGSVRDDGTQYTLNRNWYVTPTSSPSSTVYVRFYTLNTENVDLHTELGNDGVDPGTLTNFNTDSLIFTHISGVSSLDPYATGGGRTEIDPIIADFDTFGKSYTFGISSFSGFAPQFTPGSTPLPVTLIEFTGAQKDDQVVLNWSTASELNNDRFEILRSLNGRDFEQIGEISGTGTTTETQRYSYSDTPGFSGHYFYQLRQVDYDGTEDLSQVILVQFDTQSQSRISLFPVPSDNVLNVVFEDDLTDQNISIQIYSVTGKKLDTQYILYGNRIVIDTNNISNGYRILKVSLNGLVSTHSIVIKH